MRNVIGLFVLSLLWAAPALASCPTTLKPTDGYNELSAMLKCLDDRITALEGKGAQSRSAGPVSLPKPQASEMAQTAQGFIVEVLGCAKAVTTVSCRFRVTSEKDNVLNIYNDTAIFDAAGVQTPASGIAFQAAAETKRFRFVFKELIAGVPVDGELQFAETPGDARELAALRIKLSDADRPNRNQETKADVLTFRNIPLN